jgi:hypothetical protein
MEKSNRKEKITAWTLVAFSVMYCLGCLKLKLGRIQNPGAGLFPWLIGFLLLLFTLVNAYRVFRFRGIPENGELPSEGRRSSYWASLGIAACVVAYPFLLYSLKFVLATFIVVFAMLLILRYKKVLVSLAISLTVAVISFLIFSLLLGVTFPGGVLEEFILNLW